jgi:hypothetical protein
LIVFSYSPSSSTTWYSGNMYGVAYGGRVIIKTPDYPIIIEESGESSWISLPAPIWIQTGWRYYLGYDEPMSYVEIKYPDGTRSLSEKDPQLWGEMVEYKIVSIGTKTWCAYINGVGITCAELFEPPSWIQALSEVHDNPLNQLNTQFNDASYKSINGDYLLFDQEHWWEDPPYMVEKHYPYSYITHRVDLPRVFLPIVMAIH